MRTLPRTTFALLTATVLGMAPAAQAAKSTRPSAAAQRRAALLDLYKRNVDLHWRMMTNKTNTPLAPTLGTSIWTGASYKFVVQDEAQDIANGVWYDLRRDQIESLGLRIVSSNSSTAVLRVCERITSVPRSKKDDSLLPDPSVPAFVTDIEISAVYSTKVKRWLIADQQYLEEVEGKSRCADG